MMPKIVSEPHGPHVL